MKKIFWTWDLRMRWTHGFSRCADSFLSNYVEAVNAAVRYGVDAIVIWGFLRDLHGGIDTAKRILDYAHQKGVGIWPGVGIDAYGGVFFQGKSKYCLHTHLCDFPELCAIEKDGTPILQHHPKIDKYRHFVGCPSKPELMNYYRESIEWFLTTFELDGIQFEQGDGTLCQCSACQSRMRTFCGKPSTGGCAEDMKERVLPLTKQALEICPDLDIMLENYAGLTPEEIAAMEPFLIDFPDAVLHSWQAYTAGHHRNNFVPEIKISEESKLTTSNNCISIRTNGDFTDGELDDRVNILSIVEMARNAGLNSTYVYGEYPDTWPITKANYEAWAAAAE